MTEPEDPEVVAMRERAERVMARRAKERAEVATDESEPKKKKKKGRQWYHWVFDTALFLLAAYLIKTRFFDKQPEPPAPAAAPSAPASAAPRVVTRASADLLEGPAPSAARVEALPPNTAVEVVELSSAGYMKVKTATGKVGWVPAGSVATSP